MSKLQLHVEELEPRLALTLPAPAHVVIVIEENHSNSEIIGSSAAPYINSLAQQGAFMTNSYAIEHPSQPNYLDLFSGWNQGVFDDYVPYGPFSTPNLASELNAAGLTFGGYSESMPSVGFTGGSAHDLYVRKHNPWVNFSNVPSTENMPFSLFPSNFNKLPTVSIVVPNLQHDMHNGTVHAADTWLKSNLNSYVQWAKTNNSLLIVTWDEDDGSQNNKVPTIFVGQMVQPGHYTGSINHFNVLRTVEDIYDLPHAGASATAAPITGIWKTTPAANSATGDATAVPASPYAVTFTLAGVGSRVWVTAGNGSGSIGINSVTMMSANGEASDAPLPGNPVRVAGPIRPGAAHAKIDEGDLCNPHSEDSLFLCAAGAQGHT